ncbi:MAG: hypothetical protein KC431_02135, partial [Myxococcales bacterium]|nr:hypothetical protein [Myxococcales bacterium]
INQQASIRTVALTLMLCLPTLAAGCDEGDDGDDDYGETETEGDGDDGDDDGDSESAGVDPGSVLIDGDGLVEPDTSIDGSGESLEDEGIFDTDFDPNDCVIGPC